jgi:exonuclease SbcD
MRLIHTADWHLCDRLGRIDRTDDLKARVELVAACCEKHRADLLLIAGDLFNKQAKPEQIAAALAHVRGSFEPFFARGGTILAITGNHDDDPHIEVVRAGLRLAAPVLPGGTFQRGRTYLLNGPSFGVFESVAGERAQVVMLPYPNRARYHLSDTYRTREEEHRELQRTMTETVARFRAAPSFDVALPTVLMAHLHVRGANLNRNLFRMSEAEDVMIEPADLSAGWAYVALGHIHLPQCVGGAETIRYPGPLDRLDFGERTDERGVLLVDLGPAAVVGSPVWLPLPPTPMHVVAVTDPDAELPTLAERFPDRETALVQVKVSQPPDCQLTRDQIARRLHQLFPRLHQVTWANDETAGVGGRSEGIAESAATGKPVADTVRDYLAAQLASDPDERDALLALVDQFLPAVGGDA